MPLTRKSPLTRRSEIKRTSATQLRTAATDAERALWFLLRDRRIPIRFRRRHPIGPYIADFFCPAARLVIELQSDRQPENPAADDIRARFLAMRGYEVLRVQNHQIFTDADRIVAYILHAAGQRLAAPPPGA